jgi:hypothetical protein
MGFELWDDAFNCTIMLARMDWIRLNKKLSCQTEQVGSFCQLDQESAVGMAFYRGPRR